MKNKMLIFTFIMSLMVLGTAENIFAQPGSRQRPTPSGQRGTPPTTTKPEGTTPAANRQSERTTGGNLQNKTKPQPSETQQQNIQKLEDDLAAIKSGSQVTQQQKDELANSLYAMADGATKPDKAAVEKLASDLSDAMADGSFSNQEKAQLANDLETVMNSANIPAEEVEAAINSITAILKSSNVSKEDVAVIKTDLQNIATERKVNRGSRIPKKTN